LDNLYKVIGQRDIELDWLKKNYQYLSRIEKVSLLEKENENIPIQRQCELLGMARSSAYYEPVPMSQNDKAIMDLIDEIYTAAPFYGNRRIRHELNTKHGVPIGRDHLRTLMHLMGIQAIYPKKKHALSCPDDTCKPYPYLLRGVKIERPDHVWSADITYVKLQEGFAYLIAVIDWFSRYVISWKLSNSLEIDFCLECLEEALRKSRKKPEIFNSDQGSHFTSPRFTEILKGNGIAISMDGRGRCLDNIFVERLWRTVKQENIYLNEYENVLAVRQGLGRYFPFYNESRPHQSLEYRTPQKVYFR
jgi:putative transposase